MRNNAHALVATGAALVAGLVLIAAPPTQALNTEVPPSGLPSATTYSGNILAEKKGVVSWKTLAQVEPIQEGGKIIPRFSKEILGLDAKPVRVQGFMLPLDMGDHQHHFLLSAVPPHCPFCMPAGPDAIVEVVAKKHVEYSFEPIVMTGKFAVLKDDPAGVLYRLTDAEAIASTDN